MMGLRPRLASAREFAFTFPEWLEDNMEKVQTPFLVMHGTEDKVTDPEMSKRLCREAGAKDKELKLYDGAFHCELLCCTPGSEQLIGLDFSPEQHAQTKQCVEDM